MEPQQQAPSDAARSSPRPYGGGLRASWGHQSDTGPVYDDNRGPGWAGPDRFAGGSRPNHKNQGRRQKHYRKLWEHVKSVHAGDADGRHLPCEMSVEELVKVCQQLPPDASAIAAVSPALPYLDSRAMAAFMKELAKTQQLPRAMELFDWLKSLPADHELYGLCDVYTFTTAISLMGPSQQLRRALELVGEMRARGLQCNVHTYSALMNVCIKCDACDLALDVFKQMHEDKIRPNVVTYNTLVDVYGKTGQWEKAVRVLDDMRKEDLEPEVRTFNTAIIACNMCGQPQEALKVYQKLLDAGLQPISTTFTALISAYGKAGQLDKALDTFQAMIAQGCERSVITYSALISACEKAGRWELALQLFDQMQREGCTPNTVTYNSLITACQQGGQPEKACQVFDQMKFHGCRPDVVTYSALISAHNKAGQWHKSVKAFEAMHQHNCKPDSFVFQTLIDSLWGTGVAWAQARAWQLYVAAARNWQYRFVVQQAGTASTRELEYVVPAFTPGVAVLALRKWLADLVGQVESDATLLGATREVMVLSLGRSRHVKEPGSSAACAALLAVLKAFKAPFTPGNGAISAAGNVIVAEACMGSALEWLRSPALPEFLSLLVPPSAVNSRQPSPLGAGPKRVSLAPELAEDAKLDESCQRAYRTVSEFEAAQSLQPGGMAPEYLAERERLIGAAFKLAEQLELADEVVYDAVLLMDRVMSTGAAHDAALGVLFVAAALRLATLQTVSGADALAMSGVPSDALLAAATCFPAGSVTKMEDNIKSALAGDTKCISMLRSLKLYLERMGSDQQQEAPAAVHLSAGVLRLLRSVLLEPRILNSRPSVAAAAVLVAARTTVGCHPFLPGCLEALTGLSLEGEASSPSQLGAAVAVVEPLAAAAGLEPPARASPLPQFCGVPPRPLSAGPHGPHHLFGPPGHHPLAGQGMGGLNGPGSGYSTPSHGGTPTAAAAAAAAAAMAQQGALGFMPQHPQKTLLDAVVRQHASLHRAGSDMSSLSAQTCSEAGSAADLQALLSAAGGMGAPPGGVGGPGGMGPCLGPPASEPALAAAMASLQLGMMPGMPQGLPGQGMPGGHMPWLGGAPPGGYGLPDAYAQQQQQQHAGFPPQLPPGAQGSRLQQMTSPYVMPQMQHAMMLSQQQQQHLR